MLTIPDQMGCMSNPAANGQGLQSSSTQITCLVRRNQVAEDDIEASMKTLPELLRGLVM